MQLFLMPGGGVPLYFAAVFALLTLSPPSKNKRANPKNRIKPIEFRNFSNLGYLTKILKLNSVSLKRQNSKMYNCSNLCINILYIVAISIDKKARLW